MAPSHGPRGTRHVPISGSPESACGHLGPEASHESSKRCQQGFHKRMRIPQPAHVGSLQVASLRFGCVDKRCRNDGMAPHLGGHRLDGRARCPYAPCRERITDRCRPPSYEDHRYSGSRAWSGCPIRSTIGRSVRCSPLAKGNSGERCARHRCQPGGNAIDRKARLDIRSGVSIRVRLR
jgi:hypothetical protein